MTRSLPKHVQEAIERGRGAVVAKATETAPRGMNKLEASWAEVLELQRRGGEILWWRREPLRLRLADGAWYKPDFGVVRRDGAFELHETKGHMREAAGVRIKVAAEQFPFRFLLVRRREGQWAVEEVGAT